MINLDIEKVIFAIKTFNLNIKISIKKIIVIFVFEIDSNDIYKAMILINQNIMMLL